MVHPICCTAFFPHLVLLIEHICNNGRVKCWKRPLHRHCWWFWDCWRQLHFSLNDFGKERHSQVKCCPYSRQTEFCLHWKIELISCRQTRNDWLYLHKLVQMFVFLELSRNGGQDGVIRSAVVKHLVHVLATLAVLFSNLFQAVASQRFCFWWPF